MYKRMKMNMIKMILILCLLSLSACGDEDAAINGTNGSAENQNQDEMLSINLYFINKDWNGYLNENLDIDQLTTTENIIDTVMNHLITPKTEGEAKNPLPNGTAYQRYTFDGEGNLTLVFNIDYSSMDDYQFLLAKSAFVNTLCQIDGIDTVTFSLVDLLDNQNVKEETYNMDSFVCQEDINYISVMEREDSQ